jgi:hypothetical protein
MDFDPSRLRRGELLAGAGAVLLLVFMLALPWYGGAGRTGGSLTGWEALTNLRWLLVVTIAAALFLVFVQVTRRAPAIPVTTSMFVAILGLIGALALVYRVLINPGSHEQVGAYLGLVAAIGIAGGGYWSMRQEGISPKDAPADIPVVRPAGRTGGRAGAP